MDKQELVGKVYGVQAKNRILREALQRILAYCDSVRVHPDDDPIPTDECGQIARDALISTWDGTAGKMND